MKHKATLTAALLAAGLHAADPAGNSVVVVYNRQIPDSKAVAEHYARQRQVPDSQVLGFDLPKEETMTRAEFRWQLRQPLLQALQAQKLWTFAGDEKNPAQLPIAATARYAVLCYGVPLKIKSDGSLKEKGTENWRPEFQRNEAAVDSELACLPASLTNCPVTGPWVNPYYGATNAALLHPTNGVWLVARLDGPTPEIAKGLVDKALEAETNGLWGRAYFDIRSITNEGHVLGDQWISNAARICWRLGLETEMETNATTFPAGFPLSQIAVYAGWYDAEVSGPFTRPAVEFMPGAFAYHLHSFSAASLRNPNRHWAGPLLAKGATITMGCVEEPYLGLTPNVAVFVERLLRFGDSFGEAACLAQPALSWQTTVVGDPLYRPAGKSPQERHAELEKRQSPLLEWSHHKVVNLNLATGLSPDELIAYLEKEPVTRKSAVLTEKLADLYWARKKYTDGLDTYETALKRGPSAAQRMRLLMRINDCLAALGRTQRQYELMQKVAAEYPDHPNLRQFRQNLAILAEKLGKAEEAAQYRKLAEPPPPEPKK